VKAVILAAGKTRQEHPYDFPKDSPPKCLFHVGGEAILSRIIQALKEAGIRSIRVVTGYGRERIEQFNQDHDLGVEFVHNPKWDSDAVNSIIVGLKDVDDDVLLLYSDIIINAEIITKFVKCKSPLAWIKAKERRGKDFDEIVRADRNVCITKISKEKLGIFKQAYVHADNCLSRYKIYDGVKADNLGIRIGATLCETLYRNGPVHDIVLGQKIRDLDYYKQTDEYHAQVFVRIHQVLEKKIPHTTVSVVIPAFNEEEFLQEALDSVKNQTRPANEVILIDDASTDRTRQIAEDSGICRVITHQKNMGASFSLQHGVDQAQSNYIAFLGADDTYHPYFLEESLKRIKPGYATFTDYFRCYRNLEPFQVFMAPTYQNQKEFRDLVIAWALRKNKFVGAGVIIIPKKCFTQVKFEWSLRHGEDLIFLLDTIIAGYKWIHIQAPLVYYRIYGPAKRTINGYKKRWMELWNHLSGRLEKLGVPQQKIQDARAVSYESWFKK